MTKKALPVTENCHKMVAIAEADGVWWPPRSSKPMRAEKALAGSIPASSAKFHILERNRQLCFRLVDDCFIYCSNKAPVALPI